MEKFRVSRHFDRGREYSIITKYKEIPIRANLKLNWTDDEGRLLGFDWGKTHLRGAFSTLDPVYIELTKNEYAVTSVFSNLGKELVLMVENFTEPPEFVRRRSVRVEPDEENPVVVEITLDDLSLSTTATDISEHGVGISLSQKEHGSFIKAVRERLNGLEKEENIDFVLAITLPACGTVKGKGKLKNFIGKGNDVYVRLGFEVSFGKKDIDRIRRYVIMRQREIIKSLRMVE